MEQNFILGVRIDNFNKKELFEKIEGFFLEEKFHQIATINPEFILEAQKNLGFKNILNNCALNVADGFGIKLAFWRFGKHLKARIAGADLMSKVLKIADKKKLSIFLAINKDGLSTFEEIKNAILKIYPELKINGRDFDCHSSENGNPVSNHSVFTLDSRICGNDTILFCNFGAPYQEIFINSQKCDTIRLAMGVGGSFDFLTGKVRRAPKFLRLIGLEWLWRLILQPKRWKRIFNATIIFSYKILFNKE